MAMLNNQRVTLYIYIHMHTHTLFICILKINQADDAEVEVMDDQGVCKSSSAELILRRWRIEHGTARQTRRAHPGLNWLMSFCHQLSISCQYIFIHHPLLSVVPPCWQKNPDLLGITWLCYHFGCVNHEYSQNKPFSIQPLIIPRLGTAKNTPLKNNKSYPLVMSK